MADCRPDPPFPPSAALMLGRRSRERAAPFLRPETPPGPLWAGGLPNCHLGRSLDRLAHRDGYPAQIERGLEPHLSPTQLHDNAVGIPQPCSRAAARNRHARANSCVGTGDVLRPPEVMCAA